MIKKRNTDYHITTIHSRRHALKFESKETITILESAAQRELETGNFYQKCRDQAKIEGTRQVLDTLVHDEERHYRIVTNLLNEAKRAGGIDVDTQPSASAAERIKAAFPHQITNADFKSESATVGKMLKVALENEKESFNNYAAAAAKAEDREAKAVYEYLAEEENKHYILVGNLMAYLDDPSAWLYEEENLIFRRG